MSDFLALFDRLHYPAILALAMIGFYVLTASHNLMKRIAGLAILQTALALFFLALGWAANGRAPILEAREAPFGRLYSDPAPQALMLAAVVASAAILALAMALAIRVREAYLSAESDDVDAAEAAE